MKSKIKKIALYGAGNYGRTVINILRKTKYIDIVFVCDSDKRKWGEVYENFVISAPNKIFDENDFDGVFISILSDNDVDRYILSKKDIKIYKRIHELVAETIYWDISGICNAKCKYCVTGRNNINHNSGYTKNSYMNLDTFKKNYSHLYERGIISKESHLGLYNWKEPFLNPDIIDILNYCSDEGQNYILSTNASIVRIATSENTYSKCESIHFSMPGFSQESYNRIHGFVFNTIKDNIVKIKKDMLEHGFAGEFIINAHIYRFSEEEIKCLREWAEEEGIIVSAYYPYLAGNSLVADYFEGRLDAELIRDISFDLFLQWDDKISQECIKNFENPLCHQLTIDESGNLTLCCAADEFCSCYNEWGKIENLNSYEDYIRIKNKMLECKTCMDCKKYAIAYRILNCNNPITNRKESESSVLDESTY